MDKFAGFLLLFSILIDAPGFSSVISLDNHRGNTANSSLLSEPAATNEVLYTWSGVLRPTSVVVVARLANSCTSCKLLVSNSPAFHRSGVSIPVSSYSGNNKSNACEVTQGSATAYVRGMTTERSYGSSA